MSELLTGQHGFYGAVFEAMGVPYEPYRWRGDVNASHEADMGDHQRLIKQVHVQTLINMYRVQRSPHRPPRSA